ncbi:acyl-CoA thioesterase [Novosphingobium sp. 9]|uniref:acyl-CoA thioesterase n=1 Tax=Novosphingobium sp. 9 TaxID=2025349 RepID=UPI0021B508CE|nr:acyl-CoA thioesterase [Novosphingobium sp. 9]
MTESPSPIVIDRPVRLIDTIFPGETNHHGTLFGGVALAHMDKVAFFAATRHGRAPFVTARSERIDFEAPGRIGDLIEVTGRVVRVGNSSLDVEVEVFAEEPLTAERRRCTRGLFTMVAVKGPDTRLPLPPLVEEPDVEEAPDNLHMVEMVFPQSTNHYNTLFGGEALKMMGKAAFVASTRATRQPMIMAASDRIDFREPIRAGEMVELVTRIQSASDNGAVVMVELWAEELLTGARRHSATARFTMARYG